MIVYKGNIVTWSSSGNLDLTGSGRSIIGAPIDSSNIGAVTPGTGSFTSLTDSGNLTFTGTGNRITGDFSNTTFTSRVIFQSSTTNGNTNVTLAPNGTGTACSVDVLNLSDVANSGLFRFTIGASDCRINSTYSGTYAGGYLPMTFYTGGSERMRIDTSGNVSFQSSGAALSNVTSINGGQLAGFRNRIINGNFDIWQRGASFSGSSQYGADRWFFSTLTNTSIDRQTFSTGYATTYACRILTSSATNTATIQQPLESFNANTLRGKTVTLSFYAVNGSGGTLSFGVLKNSTADTLLSGSWSIIGSLATSATLSTTPVLCSTTVAIPNDATTAGLMPSITATNMANGSSTYIWGVQLEIGSTATPFEQRPIGTELALCQRFYYRDSPNAINKFFGTGFAQSSTVGYILTAFPVTMRIAPSALEQTGSAADYAIYNNGGSVACTSVPAFLSTTSQTMAATSFTCTTAGYTANGGAIGASKTTSAYLGWSAEL